MKSLSIYLHNIDDVKELVNIANHIEGDVTLSEGQHIIDAKSIIGVFSLDLSRQLKLSIENWKDEYMALLVKYQLIKEKSTRKDGVNS